LDPNPVASIPFKSDLDDGFAIAEFAVHSRGFTLRAIGARICVLDESISGDYPNE